MTLQFTKMQGLGNDFVVLDALNSIIHLDPDLIQQISDRHFGIGCDQVLLIEASKTKTADFIYRIFNADGMEVGQCGNGARCVARYLYDRGLAGKEMVLATSSGNLQAKIEKDLVAINMGIPTFIPEQIPFLAEKRMSDYVLTMNEENIVIDVVGLGNPHAVLQVTDILQAPVNRLGPKIQQHPSFPQQVNVGFMEIVSPHEIKLRVYERGAGETLACGSGACAAVVIGHMKQQLASKVTVQLTGGKLTINWNGEGTPVWMSGPAVEVFTGNYIS